MILKHKKLHFITTVFISIVVFPDVDWFFKGHFIDRKPARRCWKGRKRLWGLPNCKASQSVTVHKPLACSWRQRLAGSWYFLATRDPVTALWKLRKTPLYWYMRYILPSLWQTFCLRYSLWGGKDLKLSNQCFPFVKLLSRAFYGSEIRKTYPILSAQICWFFI